MIKRAVSILLVAACLGMLPSSEARDATAAASSIAASASAGGAVVTATLVIQTDGEALLRVTIAPQRPGFHIYSLVLPPGGVDGLGVATRIRVAGAFTADSQPQASVGTQYLRIAALGVDLPVYPDGPVTLSMHVSRDGQGPTDALVSFGLCSESTCMPPVDGLDIALRPT